MSVGILGVGVYLPEEVRTNDWWSKETVAKWKERAEYKVLRPEEPPPGLSHAGRLTWEEMEKVRLDPFIGIKERRVAPTGMLASEMEIRAAQDALARSGIDASQIDLLLCYETVPDFYGAPNAGVLHERLGLPRHCLSTQIEGVCNSLPLQLTLADAMIRSGRAHYALIVQCSNILPLTPSDHPLSAWFGDCATAEVVGPVREGRGLLGVAHRTDGRFHRAMLGGIPGKRWHEDGPVVLYSEDRKQAREMVLMIADSSLDTIADALKEAKLQREDVTFYASHQATGWLRRLTRDVNHLSHARGIDTFEWTAGVTTCNVPIQLALGEREGMLREDDVVTTFSGGGGTTWSSTVMRWGR
jgi:3-oxoacyl-[acyl-carrier-protein] synthase-3